QLRIAIVSLALMPMAPMPTLAQVIDEAGRVLAADGTILCAPTADVLCDLENPEIVKAASEIQARLDAEAAAAEAAAAEAAAKEAAAAEAAAKEAAAAEAAAKEAAAEAAAKEAAAAEAAAKEAAAEAVAKEAAAAGSCREGSSCCWKAAAAEAAAKEAAAEAAAKEAAAAEAAAKEAAAAEAAAKEAAAAEAAAAEAAAAEAAAKEAASAAKEAAASETAEAAAKEAAAAEAAAKETAAEAAAAEASPSEPTPAEQTTSDAPKKDVAPVTQLAPAGEDAAANTTAATEPAEPNPEPPAEAATDQPSVDAAAGLVVDDTPIDPSAPLIDAPVVSETETDALTTLLSTPTGADEDILAPEVAAPTEAPPVIAATSAADPASAEAALTALPAAPNAVATSVDTITKDTVRSSAEEFKAAPKKTASGKKTGLSDLERVGLFVLGALVIGQVLDAATGKTQVVSNTGDRVVVQNPDGSYGLYKDDDAILRQPGSTVRTETYDDGSSRTIVQRADGTQVVTVRDATGRVLRRAQYDRLGRELVLLDEFAPEEPVRVADLPRARVVGSTRSDDAALRAAIAARQIEKLGRGFSLRQIREIAEVRRLAVEVDVDSVTFASGSAAITPQQANSLADLGTVMQDLLAENPAEMFLVEGHTDATGGAAMNLALSDRRAETVALALSEYFAIPPENMVVQGYGETELRINTQANEAANRRVSVRVITPLLRKVN
ncbi:MAG: OmpA family protein, partial [Cypionkella sp.]|nr:OmpA family protein [Cypionkella sp.]